MLIEKENWWKLSFSAVPWSYRREREWTESGVRLPFHARPPFYDMQDGFAVKEAEEGGEESTVFHDRLSSSLAGVQVAEDAVRHYEVDSGVTFPFDPLWDLARHQEKPLFTGGLDDEYLVATQKKWKDHVDLLLGGGVA